MEAKIPANKDDLLAISEIATMTKAVTNVFIIRYITNEEFYLNYYISLYR